MAKIKGPLLSLSARGQIGKSVVFGAWRGVPYARQHVDPANPNTTAQQLTRDVFRVLDDKYKRMGPLARAPWDAAAQGRPLTGRNAVMRSNIPRVRGEADMALFVGSPGSGGGLAPSALVVAGGGLSNEIDFTISVPQAPTGWTVTRAVAVAFPDHDPAVIEPEFVTEDSDEAPVAGADSAITLTLPQANTLYVCSAWIEWVRTDGVTAYGGSLTDTATSTA